MCIYIYILLVLKGYIGIVEKKMETTMSYGFGIWGFRTCLVHLGLRNIRFWGLPNLEEKCFEFCSSGAVLEDSHLGALLTVKLRLILKDFP